MNQLRVVLLAALLFAAAVTADLDDHLDDHFDDDDDLDDRCSSDYNCDLNECCVSHRRYGNVKICVDRGEKIGSYCGGPFACDCLRDLVCVPFNETGYGLYYHYAFYGTCQLPLDHPLRQPVPAIIEVHSAAVPAPGVGVVPELIPPPAQGPAPIQRTAPLPPYIYRHSFELDDDFDDLFDDDDDDDDDK